MCWQLTPYIVILIAAAALIVFLAVLAWQHWEPRTGNLYGLLLVMIAAWTLMQALELAATDMADKIAWARLQYVSVVNIPPLWLLFVLSYTNSRWRPWRRVLALLWLEPIVTLILVFTTQHHQLVWTQITPGTVTVPFISATPPLIYRHGPWYWFRTIWVYLLIIAADVWLVGSALRLPQLHRRQTWLLVLAALMPLVTSATYVLNAGPIPGMDYTSLGFVAAAVIVTLSVLRFQMFGLVPLARSLLIERLDTGVLVLDARDCIIDINPAAQRMLGVGPVAIGKRLTEILADGDVWLRTLHSITATPTICERDGSFYDVQAVFLRNRTGRLLGQLIALHDITPHKRAEATLREAEERLRTFVDCAPIGISVNRGGKALYVNPAYARMYGYDSAEELAGSNLLDHVAPASRAEIVARLEARERGEAVTSNYEALGQRKDGSVFAYHVEVAQIRLPDGMANLAFHLDITALRQIEEALHQAQTAEHNQRILAEALRDSAAAINETLDVEAVLDRILENVGRVVPHQAADILLVEGQTARMVCWRGHCDASSAVFRTLIFSLDIPTLRWMIDTGHYCLIPDTQTDDRWTPIPQADWIRSYLGAPVETRTQIIGFLSLVSDTPGFFTLQHAGLLQAFADQAAIALEKAQLFDMVQRYSTQLEQLVAARTAELEHERAQFKAILDALADGVMHDDFNQIMYVNPAFTRLTGYTAEEVIAQPLSFLSTLFAPEFVRFPGSISETIRRGDSWHGEIRARIKEGRTAQFEATFTALTDPQNRPISKVGIFRDITPEKTWQAQKTRFINHAAHELRTPLANLKTRLYLLRRQPDRLTDHLEVMEPVVDQMTALVEELLEMSRLVASPAALKRQTVPLQTILAESVALLRHQAEQQHVRLVETIASDPLYVFADTETLGRAITRLIANAIGATPPGGQVELAALPDERATHALLRIYDGSEHLPPDQLRQMFEPFFRATEGDTQGTGLSLSIARQIVELHGGDITTANAAQRGLIVEVRLPLVNQ